MHWIFHVLLSRQNTSASGARPNPQGSFRYGSINITDTYVLKVTSLVPINGKNRAAINGISFLKPDLPFRLADQHQLRGIYKLDFPSKPMNRTPKIDRSIINATYKGFIEVILLNNDSSIQNFHLDGYSFFVVGWESLFLPFVLWCTQYCLWSHNITSWIQDGLWWLDRKF